MMENDADPTDRFRSPLGRGLILGCAIFSVMLAILIDRLIFPGHVRYVAFSLLLMSILICIFRRAVFIPSVILVLAAFAIVDVIVLTLLPPESHGLPSVIFIPIVLAWFSILYVAVNTVVKSHHRL